jgi:hypothetical protein
MGKRGLRSRFALRKGHRMFPGIMELTKYCPDVKGRHEGTLRAAMTNISNSCNIYSKIWSTSLRNCGRVIWTLLLVLLFAVPGGLASLSSRQAGLRAALLGTANLRDYAGKRPVSAESPKQSLQKKRSEQIAAARRRRRRRSLEAVALRSTPLLVRSLRSNGLSGDPAFLRFLSNSGRSPPSADPPFI